MPFDNTPPDYDVNDLISWLETQNPKRRYSYVDGCRCLVSQWLTARTGRPTRIFGCGQYGNGVQQFDVGAIEIGVAAPRPNSFGAALRRARKLAHG